MTDVVQRGNALHLIAGHTVKRDDGFAEYLSASCDAESNETIALRETGFSSVPAGGNWLAKRD